MKKIFLINLDWSSSFVNIKLKINSQFNASTSVWYYENILTQSQS